jgi:hypothetical protein
MRRGQVKRLDRGDAVGQAKFIESWFHVAAWRRSINDLPASEIILAIQPS